ncbi:MAG: DUF5522 domain-containing protein [Bacteroidota bacterium]|nr:DUF5522 domain-containing protein [Bacteroidota bacterium]
MSQLSEGIDYYINKDGLLVFTDKYLLQRGTCCGNGCLHCPFNYKNVPEPERSKLLSLKQDEKTKN